MHQVLVQTQARLPLEVLAAIFQGTTVLSNHLLAATDLLLGSVSLLSTHLLLYAADFGLDRCDLSQLFVDLNDSKPTSRSARRRSTSNFSSCRK